jgi:hypothetical protein
MLAEEMMPARTLVRTSRSDDAGILPHPLGCDGNAREGRCQITEKVYIAGFN